MSAADDMRAIADRIVKFVAARGDAWERPGTPEHLLIQAATLMTGVANGLDLSDIELITERP